MAIEPDRWQVQAGDVLTYTVGLANRSSQALPDVQLDNPLPAGLAFEAQGTTGFSYIPDENRLVWRLAQIEPGQYLTGTYAVRIQDLPMGTVVTNTVIARSVDSETTVAAATAIEVISETADDTWASPGAAEWLRSHDGRIALHIPAGAVTQRTHIAYQRQDTVADALPGLRFAFTLAARDESGQPVRSFAVPLDIALHYQLKEFSGASSGQIALFYYHDAESRWLRIPSTVDTARQIIWASVDHLTLFAAALDSGEPPRMKGFTTPSVLGLQTSLWTGDSAFRYPLELPAAPGGNVPALTLAYSSGAANQMLALDPNKRMAQASDFGLGWDLQGGGAITRDDHDRYFLEFAGGSYRLVNVGGNAWRTVPESFLQISHTDNNDAFEYETMYGSCSWGYLGTVTLRAQGTQPWTIRAPDGTTYTFGGSVGSEGRPNDYGATAVSWAGNPICSNGSACVNSGSGQSCGTARMRAYRWNLVNVQPTAGPGWTLRYAADTGTITDRHTVNNLCEVINHNSGTWEGRWYVRHTRLTAIEYGNGHYRVGVNYFNPPGHRSDIPDGFEWSRTNPNDPNAYDCDQQWMVSDYYVNADTQGDVVVQYRAATNQDWNLLWRYDLGWTYLPQHLALTDITQQNAQGASLPATTFTYQTNVGGARNGEVLQTIDNHLGGKVTLTHERKLCNAGTGLTCPGGAGEPKNGRIVVQQRVVSHAPDQDQAVQVYQYAGGQYWNQTDPHNPYWQFWGFGTVTEDLQSPGVAQQLRRTETQFNQASEQLKGKTNRATIWSGDGAELRRTEYSWSDSEAFPKLDGVKDYFNGQFGGRRGYTYAIDHQGSVKQYGNITHIREYADPADDAALYRTTERRFVPRDDAANYVVNRVAEEKLWLGNVGGTCQGQTRHVYDDAAGFAGYAQPPRQGLPQGLLKEVWRTQVCDSVTGSNWVREAQYGYDAATGNRTGERAANGTLMSTGYDAAFGAFPTSVTIQPATGNGPTLTSTFKYYGVNAEAGGTGLFGQLQVASDANTAATRYTFDGFGRLAEVRRPGTDFANPAATEKYTYTDAWPFTIHRFWRDDAHGDGSALANYREDWTFYDGLNRVIQTQAVSVTANETVIANTSYNAAGQIAAKGLAHLLAGIAPGSYRPPDWSQPATRYRYDGLDRPAEEVSADGATTSSSYAGLLTVAVDGNGHRRASSADAFGRMVTVFEHTGEAQVFEAESLPGTGTVSNGVRVSSGTAPAHLTYGPYQAPQALGSAQVARFRLAIDNSLGQNDVVARIDVHDVSTQPMQVVAQRDLRRNEFSGGINSFSDFALAFDTTGRSGHSLEYRVYWYANAQLAHDKTMLAWHGSANQTRYAYNGRNQLIDVWDAATSLNNHTHLEYDLLGHKIRQDDPDMGSWSYEYDAVGNLKRQTDARTQPSTICFYYDGHSRLTGKYYQLNNPVCPATTPSSLNVAFTYDAGANGLGRRTGMTDAAGSTAWSYDTRGRVVAETKTIAQTSFTTGYSYRADDQVQTLTYPDGEVVTVGYNARGLAQSLVGSGNGWDGSSGPTYVSGTNYNGPGQLTGVTYGNGVSTSFGYHLQTYRLTSIVVPGVLNLAYDYDAAGNLQTLTDSGQSTTTTFTYDERDRLKTARVGFTADYTYSANGNLLTKKEQGGTTTTLVYPTAGQPRPHAPVAVAGVTYGYDGNGNVIGDGRRTLVYDAENRLTQVISGTVTTTFTYDGDGKLTKRVTPEGTTLYVGQHFEVFLSATTAPSGPAPTPQPGFNRRIYLPLVSSCYVNINGQAAQLTKYYLLNGQRIAQRAGCAGAVVYFYRDNLGSTLATSAGDTTRYWPFGATRLGGLTSTPYRFTGQREDVSVGLYYYGARYYDPQIGRFIQPDTLVPDPGDPQALNRYSYSYNNPLRYTDPSGHCPMCAGAIVGGLVGAAAAWLPQVAANVRSGQALGEAALNVDHGKIIGGAIGGAIAGGTLGLGTTLGVGGVLGSSILGGFGGLLGGRAEIGAEAAYRQLSAGQPWDGQQWRNDIATLGIFDTWDMVGDTFGGGISGYAGAKLSKAIQSSLNRFGDQTISGGVPMVRILPAAVDRSQAFNITVFFAGRSVTLTASQAENFLKGFAGGVAGLTSEAFQEFIDSLVQEALTNPSILTSPLPAPPNCPATP